jgi:hypothetical protein
MSSVFHMARGVSALTGGRSGDPIQLNRDDARLLYAVREPFRSRQSGVEIVAGILPPGRRLVLESRMAANGVIFSDGVEADYLPFDAGTVATIQKSNRQALLAQPGLK